MSLLVELQNPTGYEAIPSLRELERWAQATWLEDSDIGVVVRVVDEAESCELNQLFRGKNYPTNVLSFPYEPPPFFIEALNNETPYLGDIVICLPIIQQEAGQQGKTEIQHWAHLLIHGLLHLQGFDHVKDLEAEIMEAREIDILRQLGFPNPYESDE